MYGVIVCGLKTLRVMLGSDEVPLVLIKIESLLELLLIWYTLILILAMVFMKFMYICVWKSIRQMDDKLLVRIVIINAIFQSLWLNIGASIDIHR